MMPVVGGGGGGGGVLLLFFFCLCCCAAVAAANTAFLFLFFLFFYPINLGVENDLIGSKILEMFDCFKTSQKNLWVLFHWPY